MPDLIPIRRALLSVSDKTGLVSLARVLASHGVEIISTGGTALALLQAGLQVVPIHRVTGFPEIMGGRVKTLHPAVHGAILAVRDDPHHMAAVQEHGITPIDLVCVNLYPFEQTVAHPGATRGEAIEQIDIGGPSMLRSAAKNFEWVAVATDPRDYAAIIRDMEAHTGATTLALRASLAARAFALTSRYDTAIAAYLADAEGKAPPPLLRLVAEKAQDLRYAENPHQAGALYRIPGAPAETTLLRAQQLHGKELSYNNFNDASAALELVKSLPRAGGRTAAAIVKHTNPCGAAVAGSGLDAVNAALAGDPTAGYGGILALSAEVDEAIAARLGRDDIFLEVLVAPSFHAAALRALTERWANLRLLAVGAITAPSAGTHEVRSIPGGLLVQERDIRLATPGEFVLRAGPAPSPEQLAAAAFLEPVVRALASNAVAIGGPDSAGTLRQFGAGAGQMDRVASCRLAVEKAGPKADGAVAFSDAFFPFPDGPKVLADAGVQTIVHPGGSKRDEETFSLCGARGVTCLTTGIRHFRH